MSPIYAFFPFSFIHPFIPDRKHRSLKEESKFIARMSRSNNVLTYFLLQGVTVSTECIGSKQRRILTRAKEAFLFLQGRLSDIS